MTAPMDDITDIGGERERPDVLMREAAAYIDGDSILSFRGPVGDALAERLRTAADALSQSRASRSPAAGVEGIAEGWRVVPVELTFDMLDAVTASPCFDIACLGEDVARDLWNTFLGAAPASPLADTPADIETLRRVADWIARDVPAGTTSATHMLGVVQAALSAAPPPPSSADHVPGVGNMVQSETRSPDGSAPSAAWRAITDEQKNGAHFIGRGPNPGGDIEARETYWRLYGEGSVAHAAYKRGEGPSGSWHWSEPIHNWESSWSPTHWMPLPEPPALDDGAGNGGAG